MLMACVAFFCLVIAASSWVASGIIPTGRPGHKLHNMHILPFHLISIEQQRNEMKKKKKKKKKKKTNPELSRGGNLQVFISVWMRQINDTGGDPSIDLHLRMLKQSGHSHRLIIDDVKQRRAIQKNPVPIPENNNDMIIDIGR